MLSSVRSSYKMTQEDSSSCQTKPKTDASSYCRAKQCACVPEARTDALGQLDVTLVVGWGWDNSGLIWSPAWLTLFGPRRASFFVPPVSLHPLLSIHIPYKMEPTARGGAHLQPLTLSCLAFVDYLDHSQDWVFGFPLQFGSLLTDDWKTDDWERI